MGRVLHVMLRWAALTLFLLPQCERTYAQVTCRMQSPFLLVTCRKSHRSLHRSKHHYAAWMFNWRIMFLHEVDAYIHSVYIRSSRGTVKFCRPPPPPPGEKVGDFWSKIQRKEIIGSYRLNWYLLELYIPLKWSVHPQILELWLCFSWTIYWTEKKIISDNWLSSHKFLQYSGLHLWLSAVVRIVIIKMFLVQTVVTVECVNFNGLL